MNRRRRPAYGPRRPRHNVPVNIAETATAFEAHVFCTGFPKEALNVQLTNGGIYISGTMPARDSYPDFLLQEYPVKSFERFFELSERVDVRAVTARHEDGILKISAPKVAGSRTEERRVEID